MSEPTKFTRTESAYWIKFDAESDPATWPEGVIKSSQIDRCYLLVVRTADGEVARVKYVRHGDMIRVECVGEDGIVGGVTHKTWRAVEVLSAEEWERRGWGEAFAPVTYDTHGRREPHPTESAEEPGE